MMGKLTQKHWDQLSRDETFKLSMAEFKGATIQGMKDLRDQIKDLKTELKEDVGVVQKGVDFNAKKVTGLQNQINNIKLVSVILGAVSGIVTAILAALGVRIPVR